MMFCRSIHRRLSVVLLLVFLMCWTISSSAANTKSDGSTNDPAVQTISSSASIDVRPMVFDPVLSRGATPTSATALSSNANDKQPPTIIPLPPAAWTGMAGLISLGLIRGRHKLRRFLS